MMILNLIVFLLEAMNLNTQEVLQFIGTSEIFIHYIHSRQYKQELVELLI